MLVLVLRFLVLAIGAMVINVAAAFGWVAIYSLAIAPGQSEAAYQVYAEQVAPWCSVIAGAPILFGSGWLSARWAKVAAGWSTGMWVGILYVAIDLAILIAMGALSALGWIVALSFVTKLIASALGGEVAAKR